MADRSVSLELKVDAREAEISIHKARRAALILKRSIIAVELEKIEERIQELCDHDWHFAQTVGEGRYCAKCMKHDLDCDD